MGFFQTLGNAIGSAAGGNLIGAGVSLLGGLMGRQNNSDTNKANLSIARENNALQRQMFYDQLAFNERMWQKNNDYNTPSAQMQRYLSAGLNPYMMFGQNGGSGVSASPASGVQPPQLNTPTMQSYDPSASFSSAGNFLSDAQIKRAQVENIREDTKQKAVDNLSRNAENLSRIEKLVSETHSNYARAALSSVEHELKLATFDSVVYQAELQNRSIEEQNQLTYQTRLGVELDNIFKDMHNRYYPSQISAELARVWSQVKLNQAQTAVSFAQQKKLAADTVESVLRANKMEIENKYIDRLSDAMVRSAEANTYSTYYDMLNPDNPYQWFDRSQSAGISYDKKELEKLAQDFVNEKKKRKQ